jgi:hypothetical protein
MTNFTTTIGNGTHAPPPPSTHGPPPFTPPPPFSPHPAFNTTATVNGTTVIPGPRVLQHSAFVVLILGALLSVVGCVVIIATYGRSRALQSKIVMRQIFFQSIATLIHSLAYLLSFGQVDTDGQVRPFGELFCNIQGVLLSASNIASIVYNFYIAFDLLSFVGYTPQVKKHRLLYQLMVWPVALLVGIGCFAAKIIGPDSGLCWIIESAPAARWLTFYAPLFAVLAFCTFTIFAIPYKLRKMKLLDNNLRIVNTAAAYNAIFLCCWIPTSTCVSRARACVRV